MSYYFLENWERETENCSRRNTVGTMDGQNKKFFNSNRNKIKIKMSRSRLSVMEIGVHFWPIFGVLRLACFKNLKYWHLLFGIARDVLSFFGCVDILRIRCFV
ncbi:unnamed protein product [Meloidogyne enterolobii]|uniref:Uncharacterized protein n=1 Tax=Meloidogyne enterolobii TaxID=390850 RepID=A0ACB1ADX3_MELEN